MKNKKHIVLNEYKSLFVKQKGEVFDDGQDDNKNKVISQKTFDNISTFVSNVENDEKKRKVVIKTNGDDGVENVNILQIAQKKINGKNRPVLTANSFVGVIVTNDGTTIEILPKINTTDNNETRGIFLKMLRALRQTPDNKIG